MFLESVKLYLKNFVDIFIIYLIGAAFLIVITSHGHFTGMKILAGIFLFLTNLIPFLMIAYMTSQDSVRRFGFINLYRNAKKDFVRILAVIGLIILIKILFYIVSVLETEFLGSYFDRYTDDILGFFKAIHEKGDFYYYFTMSVTLIVSNFLAVMKSSVGLFCFIVLFKTLSRKISLWQAFKGAIESVKENKRGFSVSAIGIVLSFKVILVIIYLVALMVHWVLDSGMPFMEWVVGIWIQSLSGWFSEVSLSVVDYFNISIGRLFSIIYVIVTQGFPNIGLLFYIYFAVKFLNPVGEDKKGLEE